MTKQYSADSIQVIENLEAVRKRPGMYIGTTGVAGLHHLLWEILDNSIDEFLAGYCKKIIITIEKDNSIIVEDDGRGIPVEIHSKLKIPAVELVFTKLHAGGKFGGENSGYKMSGGLHGVGASVVNALSEYVDVTVRRNKQKYGIKFLNGGKSKTKLSVIGSSNTTGTIVHFKPDSLIFSTTIFNSKTIQSRLREMAFLNQGLTLNFVDKRENIFKTYNYPNGLNDFILHINKGHKVWHDPIIFEQTTNDFKIQIAFQYASHGDDKIFSFVNNIKTPDGGTHEQGFKTALTKTVNEYARDMKYLKPKDINFDGQEIRSNMTVIVSIYVTEQYLQFEGQTKSKLGTTEAKTLVESLFYSKFKFWLKENKSTAKEIIDSAFIMRKSKEEAKKIRKLGKSLLDGKKQKKLLSGKLVSASTSDPKKKELFLVEGDSAGGSAKLGRDNKTQAILPLKGKVINVNKAPLSQIVANEELMTIIHTIGTGFGKDFDEKKLKYGKIIIMTDADTDGAHIQTLLLTFFYKYMSRLIDKGYIYIAMPPLYKVTKKGSSFKKYLWSDDELKMVKKNENNLEIQRYKGLGEMNYEQLWETTMDPETRTLVQVNIEDIEQTNIAFETLMGSNPILRRKWIEENVNFSIEDDFETTAENYLDEINRVVENG